MKRLIRMLVLILIILLPIYVNAEQKNKVEVYYNIPANVMFKNENLVIKEEVNCGEKLLEPSHIEIEGYIFKGWYNGSVRWDFNNDIVNDDITLTAKYLKKDSFNLNVIVDKKNTIKTSILNNINIDNYLTDVSENDDVDIIFKVTDATDTITDTEKEKFDSVIDNNKLVLGKYIDLSLFMEINGNASTKKIITETSNKVKVEITIPEDIRFNNRKYSILRLHNNNVEIIHEGFPTKDWKLTFETDKFSLYAIAYNETKYKPINSPKTGDNIILWINALIISVLGLESIIIMKKKQTTK